MRFAFGNGLVLLLSVLASGPLRADLFWKVAAQAPLAPQVSLILGDDRRTIAFGTGGTWEFDGTGWVKVRLLFEGKEPSWDSRVRRRVDLLRKSLRANAPLQFTLSTIWATWRATASDEWEAHVFDGDRWSEGLSLPPAGREAAARPGPEARR